MKDIRKAISPRNCNRSTKHANTEYGNHERETQEAYSNDGIEMNQYRSFSGTSFQGKFSPGKTSNRAGKNLRSRDRFSTDYRGFSTSIADMYRYADQERVDCCSISCFGCIQADRNRFLVNGTKPPGLCRRICVHVILPSILFGIALFVAFNIPDPWMNEVLCYAWVFVILLYFYSQCDKGSLKRRDVRRDLLLAKYKKLSSGRSTSGRSPNKYNRNSEDTEDYGDSDEDEEFLMGQTNSDVRNAHAICCGCYTVDRHSNLNSEAEEDITCCARIFNCFTNICCGMCGKYVLCCGFSGVAQESREIESLLRPGVLRIDYITMQPMMEYYPKIYQARNSTQRPTSWWYDRLSIFSRQTINNCVTSLVLLLVWSLLSTRLNHKFGPKNYFVLFLTLLQSFFILAAVYWKHTKDVSIDALVKFFAVGFCLSTTSAIFFELILGLMVRVSMALLMAVSGIGVMEENGYTLFESRSGNVLNLMQEVNYGGVDYHEYLKTYGNDHPIIYTVYLFAISFILAALIEETCKYFGYRMVDHPDFYSETEVDEAVNCYEEELSMTSFSNQNRSLKSKGAAITVSMVAVGVGFACCENLVYVFIYGKANYTSEIIMLLARSLFPIHPIAAALQSIQVCKRDLENEKLRLGGIMLPGILFHGLFDFMLVWIDYIGNRKGNYVDEDDGIETESGSDKISSIVSVFVLMAGLMYYFQASRQQRKRLASLDGERVAADSNLM
jgi:RsiW-degrading membrane proteinase PrsW (M82 family)